MPTTSFSEILVARETPWAACVALEEFFAAGGQCESSDRTNWAGIAYTCEMKADGIPPTPMQLHHSFGWTYLAISIHEAMASKHSAKDSWGFIKAAMWLRTKMIVRCGNHPHDELCDCDKVVKWCLTTPQVEHFLKMMNVPPFGSLEPEVREIANILATLITANRLEKTGVVADFMAAIQRARATTESKVQ